MALPDLRRAALEQRPTMGGAWVRVRVSESSEIVAAVLRGALLAESLRVGAAIEVPGLTVTRLARRDVAGSATAAQPSVWTFLEFEAPDELADQLAEALAGSLLGEGGWYANFTVGDAHVVVFAGRIFRIQRGDRSRRAEIEEYARQVGVPRHQMDWGE